MSPVTGRLPACRESNVSPIGLTFSACMEASPAPPIAAILAGSRCQERGTILASVSEQGAGPPVAIFEIEIHGRTDDLAGGERIDIRGNVLVVIERLDDGFDQGAAGAGDVFLDIGRRVVLGDEFLQLGRAHEESRGVVSRRLWCPGSRGIGKRSPCAAGNLSSRRTG